MIEVVDVAAGVYKVSLTEADFDRLKEIAINRHVDPSEALGGLIAKSMVIQTWDKKRKDGDNGL